MIQLLLGSFLLSVVHAAIPNHWIPLVAISKSEKWPRSTTLTVTAISGLAHTASSIAIGLLVGLLGYKLSGEFEVVTSIVAPLILVGMGVIYLILDFRGGHHHHHHFDQAVDKSKKSLTAIVISLSVAMFFSPCIEIEAYYFHAGTQGWMGVLAVSIVYLIVTVLGMLILVDLGLRGAKRLRSHFLEHHEKKITGIILILSGLAAYFIEF
jgi:hypothetical protein